MGGAMVPAGPTGLAPHGPIGKDRNPIMVLVLSVVTCYIYLIYWLYTAAKELADFRQKDDINPIMYVVPVINLLELLKTPERVAEAKRMAGIHDAQPTSPILYLLLGWYFWPKEMNEVWAAARARGGG